MEDETRQEKTRLKEGTLKRLGKTGGRTYNTQHAGNMFGH